MKKKKYKELIMRLLTGIEADCRSRNVDPYNAMENHTWLSIAYAEAKRAIKEPTIFDYNDQMELESKQKQ